MDEYFEWYNMSNAQRINMARLKVMCNPRYFWKIIVRDVDLRRRPPILSRDQIRDILKEKYVPAYYMCVVIRFWPTSTQLLCDGIPHILTALLFQRERLRMVAEIPECQSQQRSVTILIDMKRS